MNKRRRKYATLLQRHDKRAEIRLNSFLKSHRVKKQLIKHSENLPGFYNAKRSE